MDIPIEHQQLLTGRSLLQEEIPFKQQLEHYIQQQYVTKTPAMTKTSTHYICNRCGETSQQWIVPFDCANCHTICHYCRTCIQLGKITSCRYLYESPF